MDSYVKRSIGSHPYFVIESTSAELENRVSWQLKSQIKSKFPFLVPLWRRVRPSSFSSESPKHVFTNIYHENVWNDDESISGPGSNLVQTETIRRALPRLIQDLGCKSLLDLPCGDFNWMKLVDLDIDYVGGDIVEELIRSNQENYGSTRRNFINLDLLQDKLPRVDIVFCRDCLVHLSYQHIFRALKNIRVSGSTYILTTTFVERETNEDILTGQWRTINLQLPPFNLPEPIRLINEACPLEDYHDKSLGLWKTENIPDF